MDFQHFKASLAQATPPDGLPVSLQALWQDGNDRWDAAHDLLQSCEGQPPCDWVHAYLHRKEGDATNAAYWYRQVGKPVYVGSLEEEWAAISTALLAQV